MKQTPEVKIAKIQEQAKLRADLIKLFTNPVLELLGAYIILEVLKSRKIIGTGVLDIKESVLMTAIAGAVALQQLQPTLPLMYQGSAEGSKAMLDLIGKAAPALLMAGA